MKEKTKFLLQNFLICFFKNLLFLKKYLVLVLTRNLDAAQVTFIISAYSISSLLTQIPLGVLSDFLGSKILIICSILVLMFGYIVVALFSKNPFSFQLIYACFGIYDTIYFSAREALFYNGSKYLNLKNSIPHYKNLTRIISFFAMSIAAFFGGKLIYSNFNLVLKIDIFVLVFYLFVIICVNECKNPNIKKLNSNYIKSLKNGIKYAIKHKTLLNFIIFEGIWASILTIFISFCPVFYKEMTITNNINVMLTFQILVIAITQLFFVDILYKKTTVYKRIILYIIGALCGIISIYLYNGLLAYILNILFLLFTQVAEILIYTTVQDLVPSKSRACVVAIKKFINAIFKLVFLYILGFIFKRYNYRIGFLILFIFYFICCFLFLYIFYNDKHLRKKNNRIILNN